MEEEREGRAREETGNWKCEQARSLRTEWSENPKEAGGYTAYRLHQTGALAFFPSLPGSRHKTKQLEDFRMVGGGSRSDLCGLREQGEECVR